MKGTVLLTSPMPRRARERLESEYEVWGPFPRWPNEVPDDERSARTRALLTYGTVVTDAAAMDRFPNLGLICCYASGYEAIDLDAAAARGIAVCNSPGSNAAAVADLALGLLIASTRGIVEGDRYVRDGRWARTPSSGAPGLTGRKAGIYGFGEIGRRIASRCSAFEMEVGYHGRTKREGVEYAYHGTLRALAEWADILMISVRAGEGNRHAVGEEVLAALGSKGHIINVARGSVIDEKALVRALEQKTIAGAGLDVFEGEPSVSVDLLNAPRTVFTPHIGGNTFEAHDAAQGFIMENLAAFFAGRPIPYGVGHTR